MSASFFRLQQLISPSLPIGAFTYSQGMEWAVEGGWIKTADDVYAWLESLLETSLVCLDLPILARLYQANAHQSEQAFGYWSQYLLASRETSELRSEEKQRGRAFVTLLEKLPESSGWSELSNASSWRDSAEQTQLAGFGLACQKWQITPEQTLNGYLWSWLENMVIVAVKLIPLGQTDGQRVLFRFSDGLGDYVQRAIRIKDDEIGASAPAMAIASSQHETQYCRLFRS